MMLQTLLAERFALSYHYTRKEFTLYNLVVAKGGPKLRRFSASADPPDPRDDRPPRIVPDAEGFPILPEGDKRIAISTVKGGVISTSARGQAIAGLVGTLERRLGSGVRVADQTGLTRTD